MCNLPKESELHYENPSLTTDYLYELSSFINPVDVSYMGYHFDSFLSIYAHYNLAEMKLFATSAECEAVMLLNRREVPFKLEERQPVKYHFTGNQIRAIMDFLMSMMSRRNTIDLIYWIQKGYNMYQIQEKARSRLIENVTSITQQYGLIVPFNQLKPEQKWLAVINWMEKAYKIHHANQPSKPWKGDFDSFMYVVGNNGYHLKGIDLSPTVASMFLLYIRSRSEFDKAIESARNFKGLEWAGKL